MSIGKKIKTFRLPFLQNYLEVDDHDFLKLALASAAFFCIVGAYSTLHSFKTSIFLGFIGREYEPIVKILGMFITIPAIFVHAKIVDRFKSHQVIYFFMGFYVLFALASSYFFAHPIYGISNTQTSPYRLVGWCFELCMNMFNALVIGTFWSFINSISTPALAKKGYGFIVLGSRLGGISIPLLCWIILHKVSGSDAVVIPVLTAGAALLLLGAAYCIFLINRKIPKSHLFGYRETCLEKKKIDEKKKTGIFEGLRLILVEPYVFGVFGLVFSLEVINIIFDYQMHVMMSIETNNQVMGMSSFMLFYTVTFQVLGLLFVLFGTSTLFRRLGVRYCLFITPIATIILSMFPVFYPHLITMFVVMVILRALNYSFTHPLREILFVPTVKDIQFKSKAWIELFGRVFSKTAGSSLNMIAIRCVPRLCIILESVFAMGLSAIGILAAAFVGIRYVRAIKDRVVIGRSEQKLAKKG